LKDSATDDELAAVETGHRNRLAGETWWSRGLRLATPTGGMIHECLLVAWIVLAVSWFVCETWLRAAAAAEKEVSPDADSQPHQPAPISHQEQVT